MSSRSRSALATAIASVCIATLGSCHRHRAHWISPRELRVCADPANLPYSNVRGEGFENRLAELVAREMHATVKYTWQVQRRGLVRRTLGTHACDVLVGVPTSLDRVLATVPYYRSTYVFVSRHDRALALGSLDDPRLRTLRLGVQLVGDDGANTPPVHALSVRGIVDNVVGFSVVGDGTREPPGGDVLHAVQDGRVDAAIVWGPLAGFGIAREAMAFDLAPIVPDRDGPYPFTFAISMGVRRGDVALKSKLDAILVRRRAEIDALLASYDVPRAG